MTPIFLLGLAGATVAVLRARLQTATVVLFAVLFLVPGNLVLTGFHSGLPVFRIVLWSYLVGLVLRAVRGEIDADTFRPTAVQGALVVFLGVALLNGIALTPVDNQLVDAALRWTSFADQLVVLTAVLVAARALGVWSVARMIAGFAVVVALVAVWEHFSETSYARWWFQQAGKPGVRVAGSPLQPRGDELRVRGPYQFALEFSWVAVMLMPLVLLVASRVRSRLALLGPGLLGLALLWSWSRSSWPGLVVGLVVLAVASGLDRRTSLAVVAVGVVAGAVLLLSPGVGDPLAAADEDSVESRSRRLAIITETIADEPYTGIGLAGPRTRGLGGADATYVLVYAFLGVPGVASLGIAHAAALGTCGAALLNRRHRALAAAALGGVGAGILGNFALDLSATPGTGKLFWILAALGAAVASDVSGPPARRSAGRLAVVPAALVVGVVAAAAWPSQAAATYRFETIENRELAGARASVEWGGHHLVNTACEVVAFSAESLPPGTIDCLDPREGPGIGYLRLEAADRTGAEALAAAVEREVSAVLPGFRLHAVVRADSRPTAVRTAPVWLPAVALAAVWLVPGLPGTARGRPRDHGARPEPERIDAMS